MILAGGISNGEITSRLVPRVTVPLLLLGGRYDYIFPVDARQMPLIDPLGTPDEDKRHVIFEDGHLPLPRAEMIRENPRVARPLPESCRAAHSAIQFFRTVRIKERTSPWIVDVS